MLQKETGFDLPAKIEDFVSQKCLTSCINGQYTSVTSDKTFDVIDPGSGNRLAVVADCGEDEIEAAVTAGEKAFKNSGWATMPVNERAVLLHRLADLVEKEKDALAKLEALDCGKVLANASWDIENFCQTLRYYTDLSVNTSRRFSLAVSAHEAWTVRHPYGVCAFIFPWNFPFLLLGWGISAALAAGNTVVVKPAEDTPLSTLYFGSLAKEAGIPDGVVNIVPGLGETAGAALARHPRIKRMSFTGSPEVGRLVGGACGENLVPVKLELGGKGAEVVFDDIDLEDTVDKLVQAITFHTGQVCCTASRWIVQESCFDRFVDSCQRRFQQVVVGHGLTEGTQMGPVVSQKQQDRILGYLEKGKQEGAEVLFGGTTAAVAGFANGHFVAPALLTGSSENVAAREEIFGPVAYVVPFGSDDEGVELANSTPYGLANSVWTGNLERAVAVAESMVAGNSWINAHNVFVHGVPYGGVNLSGLGGGVLGPETYFDYLRQQSVVRPL